MSNPINPFRWFDKQAGAAAEFYAATFPGARLLGGSPIVVSVQVGGLTFSLLNGGPQFKVNPSISKRELSLKLTYRAVSTTTGAIMATKTLEDSNTREIR